MFRLHEKTDDDLEWKKTRKGVRTKDTLAGIVLGVFVAGLVWTYYLATSTREMPSGKIQAG